MDNILNELKSVLEDAVLELKPAPMQPDEEITYETVTFDHTEKDNTQWRALVKEHIKSAKSFEIHCWMDEDEEILQALQYGEIKPSDWKKGTIIEGAVTPEFVKMLLNMPKPVDTEVYNKMTPFFTISFDNGFSSCHYGTEIYVKNGMKISA